MTNGDCNPFFAHERLPGDNRQRRFYLVASAVAAVLAVAILLWVLSMR